MIGNIANQIDSSLGHFPILPVNSELQLLPKQHYQMKPLFNVFQV